MNILLVVYGGIERSGICMFLLRWVECITSVYKDNIVYLYFNESVRDTNIELEYEILGAKIFTGEMERNASLKSIKNQKKITDDIKKIMNLTNIDLIHINSGMFGFNRLVLSEAKKLAIPIRITHSHGKIDEKLIDLPIHFFLRRVIAHLSTAYAGCSKSAGEYMFGKKGISSMKWNYIPNTINARMYKFDNDKRKQYRASIGLMDNTILLGAVGYLEEVKNHIFLIDVLNSLIDKGWNVSLIILGEGSKRDALIERAKDLNIYNRLILYGITDDVSGWLSSMDYYLMPSITEGLPISAIEAQANGLICFLSNRMSNEIDISDDIYHLPIDNGVDVWVDALCRIKPNSFQSRKQGVENVCKAGFDMNSTPKYVKQLYGIE